MNLVRTVLAFDGDATLIGLALGLFFHPYWFAINAFVGLNMLQAAFTGFCPLAMILKRLGLKPGMAFA